MELYRIPWMSAVLLLVLRTLSSATPLSGSDNKTEINFNCYNDYEELIFCQFLSPSDGSNCTEFNLNISSESFGIEKHCVFKQCPGGKCCCTVSGMSQTFIIGYSHTAELWKGTQLLQSKVIPIQENIKPKAPTIISVNKSNLSGNYIVTWKINSTKYSFSNTLLVNLTWRKKGEMKEESETISSKKNGEINEYEILSRRLEPSTTYVVSLKSYTEFSGLSSDSSQELEFTTSASDLAMMLPVIISLSLAAVIITSALFVCYVRFKAKWWDTVAKCPHPTLLSMSPSEQKLLKPSQTSFSTICIDPAITVLSDSKDWSKISLIDSSGGSQQQSSGVSTGFSSLNYANTEPTDIIVNVQEALSKAFPQLGVMSSAPASQPTESNTDNGLRSGPYNPCTLSAGDFQSSSGFDNKTYSILIPSCEKQIQTQAVMPCDPAYRPSEGDMLSNTQLEQQVSACMVTKHARSPPAGLSVMQTDFSYQQLNADAGSSSHAEDSGLSCVSGYIETPAPCDLVSGGEAGCENCADAVKGATQLHENDKDIYSEGTTVNPNPCYDRLPANVLPPVQDEYQPFQSLVEQPDILFAEQSIDERGERLDKYSEESFTKTPQNFFLRPMRPDFFSNAQGLPEAESTFLSFPSADTSMPIITDCGYKSV